MESKRVGWILLGLLICIFCVAGGCARYALSDAKSSSPNLAVEIDAPLPEALVVRVENPTDQPLHLNWEQTTFRWPNGFDSPVRVVPADALSVVYPAGMVEYRVTPVHRYLPPDRIWHRRTSLDSSLVPDGLFEQLSDRYWIWLVIPVCHGDDAACSCPCNLRDEGSPWRLERLEATIERL